MSMSTNHNPPKANLRLQRITILLPTFQLKRLKHLAVDEGASASDVVRRALDHALRERENDISKTA